MKTALVLITATIVPGGFVILAIGLIGHILARRRKRAPSAGPASFEVTP